MGTYGGELLRSVSPFMNVFRPAVDLQENWNEQNDYAGVWVTDDFGRASHHGKKAALTVSIKLNNLRLISMP